MQQLNVLPINVSKNIEAKDDSAAFSAGTSNDDFSKHIDKQLAKNNQGTDIKGDYKAADAKAIDNKSNKANQNNDAKEPFNAPETPETQATKSDTQTQNATTTQEGTEEEQATNKEQKVADTGKKDDATVNNEQNNSDQQAIDESVLLMTFLNKADKTLVTTSVVNTDNDLTIKSSTNENSSQASQQTQETELNELPDDEKAKHETQLLLKSSGLVAELSGVSKAVHSNLSQKSAENVNLSSQSNVNEALQHTNTPNATLNPQGLTEALSDISTEPRSISKTAAEIDIPIDQNIANVSQENNQTQQASISESEDELLNSIMSNTEKSPEKLQGKAEISLNNQADRESNNLKLTPETQVTPNKQSQLKSDVNLTSTVSFEQNLAVNPLSRQENIKDPAKVQLAQAIVNTSVDAETSLENEAELNAKINNLAEHTQAQSTEGSKGENSKGVPKASVDSAFYAMGGHLEASDKAAREAYNRVEQQTIETLNPLGSTEISQSQKTNTQLHHETIAIFRKDFADAVKDKVMLIVSQKLQQFDITLDPPELGNMQIRVNLQGEQASVNFIVQNQQAKEALDQNMHKLRDLLAAQGVDVGDANVEQQSQQSNSQQENKEGTTANNHNGLSTNTAEASDSVEHNLSASLFNSSTQAIDYYA